MKYKIPEIKPIKPNYEKTSQRAMWWCFRATCGDIKNCNECIFYAELWNTEREQQFLEWEKSNG